MSRYEELTPDGRYLIATGADRVCGVFFQVFSLKEGAADKPLHDLDEAFTGLTYSIACNMARQYGMRKWFRRTMSVYDFHPNGMDKLVHDNDGNEYWEYSVENNEGQGKMKDTPFARLVFIESILEAASRAANGPAPYLDIYMPATQIAKQAVKRLAAEGFLTHAVYDTEGAEQVEGYTLTGTGMALLKVVHDIKYGWDKLG